MSKYLYGASVQGIQEFIFATNQLKEIEGASEIVKNIEDMFEKDSKLSDDKILLNAAGNIKAVFDSYDTCQNLLREFPKKVMQSAYGITISQAVVKIDQTIPSQDEIDKLEVRLKTQRNIPSVVLDPSFSIIKLHARTARPMVSGDGDMASSKKVKAQKESEFKELKDLSNKKNKIAIIHIDGNGLGQMIPQLKKRFNMELKEFSDKLDKATKEAYAIAIEDIEEVRSVVLGGDDVTVICNANDALQFSMKFLEAFEKNTKEIGVALTACGGIAFCNEKYPFHYAIGVAEALCAATKKDAKKYAKEINEDLAPSSLMFHNIQGSNFQNFEQFVKDELTVVNESETIRFDYGPYYLNKEDKPLLQDFMNSVEAYRCEGSPITKLRSWLSELYKNNTSASFMLERINAMAEKTPQWSSCIMNKNLKRFDKELSNEKLLVEKDGCLKTPIYDVLQIHTATDRV